MRAPRRSALPYCARPMRSALFHGRLGHAGAAGAPAGLLARLASPLRQHGLTGRSRRRRAGISKPPKRWPTSSSIAVRWELQQMRARWPNLDFPLIVLKGAAYVAAGLPAAAGEPVQRHRHSGAARAPGQVESALMLAGWHAMGLSEYDKRYYRRWMHEIPAAAARAARHGDRRAPCHPARYRALPSGSAKLRSRAVAVEGLPGIQVLAAEDRILHSATHAVPRRRIAARPARPDRPRPAAARGRRGSRLLAAPAARADELQLSRSLFYALRYTAAFSRHARPGQA
jgi:hypothetical protein